MQDESLTVSQVLDQLNQAIESGDADSIEDSVMSAYKVGLRADFAPALITLLGSKSHYRHEDIARALQLIKEPSAVDALYQTALTHHEYLDFDDGFGLARMCTWALADIGTTDAYAKLQSLAVCENSLIADYAQERIDNWESEQHRKGNRK
ncbi:MAG TPA: hypothetical protein VF627_05720 [Abditibacterium sp.]|jgi:hypothetical protein